MLQGYAHNSSLPIASEWPEMVSSLTLAIVVTVAPVHVTPTYCFVHCDHQMHKMSRRKHPLNMPSTNPCKSSEPSLPHSVKQEFDVNLSQRSSVAVRNAISLNKFAHRQPV